jgi:cytidylate kinase
VAGPFIVAIDGPAGAGKSSASNLLARRLDFALVDTGAIYRCVALAATRAGTPLDADAQLEGLLRTLELRFISLEGDNRVFLRGPTGEEDVSSAIRTLEISKAASAVSARPVVRAGLLELQRRLARATPKGAVLEGRDIGTVVFPDAGAKFFLTATSRKRAERRFAEIRAKGPTTLTVEQVLEDQNQRDRDDSSREVAPLRAAPDSVIIDSTEEPLSLVVDRMEKVVRQRLPPA